MVQILVASISFPSYTKATMADPVWGQLPKAQDDPQTIDEAIASAIAAHEADPEAHLGMGESLETHRSNDILDHPLGSVLVDKSTLTEIVFNEGFANLDGWNVAGSVDLAVYPQVQFDAYGPANRDASIYVPVEVVEDWITFDHDWLIQFTGRLTNTTANTKFWLGEDFNNKLAGGGIGFIYDGANLKARETSNGSHQDLTIVGIDVSEGHIYRVQWSVVDQLLYFYVDGLEVASLTPNNLSYGSDIGPSFGINVPSSNDEGSMYISNLVYARSLD